MSRTMRLFLLPISTRRSLLYCEKATEQIPTSELSYLDRITNKANATWADWEKGTSGWKLKVTQYGNMMFKRIPFEEWGLKSIPPLTKAKEKATTPSSATRAIDVTYPASFQGWPAKESVSDVLRRLATERQDFHRRKMWYSIIGMPATIPFALIPVIPNIPFFYVTFRAWSHWRALRGSQHLQHLVESNLLRLSPSQALDRLYAKGLLFGSREKARAAPSPSKEQTDKAIARVQSEAARKEEVMILPRWNAQLMAESVKIPALEVEMERAAEQVEKSLQANLGASPEKTTGTEVEEKAGVETNESTIAQPRAKR